MLSWGESMIFEKGVNLTKKSGDTAEHKTQINCGRETFYLRLGPLRLIPELT